MGDTNPIRTLGDYSKPSHEGYRNTIELLEGNNVVPLRSDTICTRSSSSNLVPPFIDPESVIRARRRNLSDPSLLLDFEEININSNSVQGPPPACPPPQNHNGQPGFNLQMPALDL
ncbi:hypothetical protein Tco_0479321 [Tanacetum coccineum]